MAVIVMMINPFPLRSGPAYREAWGQYDGAIARDPYDAEMVTALSHTYVQPFLPTLTTRDQLMTNMGMNTWIPTLPSPLKLTTRDVAIKTLPSAGETGKGRLASVLSLSSEILIQVKIWHILIQVES